MILPALHIRCLHGRHRLHIVAPELRLGRIPLMPFTSVPRLKAVCDCTAAKLLSFGFISNHFILNKAFWGQTTTQCCQTQQVLSKSWRWHYKSPGLPSIGMKSHVWGRQALLLCVCMFLLLMLMYTGLIKLLLLLPPLAARLSPFGDLMCSELMTPREEWPTWTVCLTDVPDSRLLWDWAFCPYHLQFGYNLKSSFLFPSIRERCEAHCFTTSEPWKVPWWFFSLGSQLSIHWKTSAGSTVCWWIGWQNHQNTSLPCPELLGPWQPRRQCCPAKANEDIHVHHYVVCYNQGIYLWDFWGLFPTVARLKDQDSDQRLKTQFKSLHLWNLPWQLTITNFNSRVGNSLFCAHLLFNSASHCNHTKGAEDSPLKSLIPPKTFTLSTIRKHKKWDSTCLYKTSHLVAFPQPRGSALPLS